MTPSGCFKMHWSLHWDTPPENLPTQQNAVRLWQGTRHTHIDGHTCYTPAISGVHSLIHLFVCSLHLMHLPIVDGPYVGGGRDFRRE